MRDGREAQACGNGTRAVAAWLAARDGMARSAIDTLGGLLACVVDADGTVEVTMGQPRFDWQQIPLARAIDDTARAMLHPALPPAFLVNIGNPHAVFFDANSDLESLARQYGAALECRIIPRKSQYRLCLPRDNGEKGDNHALHLRVWERGAGLTRACGSGRAPPLLPPLPLAGLTRHGLMCISQWAWCKSAGRRPGAVMCVCAAPPHLNLTARCRCEREGENFGCRLNALEGDIAAAMAERAGVQNATIINGCAVTGEACGKPGKPRAKPKTPRLTGR